MFTDFCVSHCAPLRMAQAGALAPSFHYAWRSLEDCGPGPGQPHRVCVLSFCRSMTRAAKTQSRTPCGEMGNGFKDRSSRALRAQEGSRRTSECFCEPLTGRARKTSIAYSRSGKEEKDQRPLLGWWFLRVTLVGALASRAWLRLSCVPGSTTLRLSWPLGAQSVHLFG
jgi:hypothetical protein